MITQKEKNTDYLLEVSPYSNIKKLVDSIESSLYFTNSTKDIKLQTAIQDGTLQSKIEEMPLSDFDYLIDFALASSYYQKKAKNNLLEDETFEGLIANDRFYLKESYVNQSSSDILKMISLEYGMDKEKVKDTQKILLYSAAGVVNAPGVLLGGLTIGAINLLAGKHANQLPGLGVLAALAGASALTIGTLGTAALIGTASVPLGIAYAGVAGSLALLAYKKEFSEIEGEIEELTNLDYMRKICNKEIELRAELSNILE